MKNSLFIVFFVISSLTFGQVDTTKIYDVVDVAPEYPGGSVEMTKFIVENFTYPEEAYKLGDRGTCWIEVVIRSDGRLTDAKVVRGVSIAVDQECLRVVELMPNWEPGTNEGVKVNTHFILPIVVVNNDYKKNKKDFKKNKRKSKRNK